MGCACIGCIERTDMDEPARGIGSAVAAGGGRNAIALPPRTTGSLTWRALNLSRAAVASYDGGGGRGSIWRSGGGGRCCPRFGTERFCCE